MPLTIEGQLESYYLDENHTERHEILWHAWNQNKRWINQLLQMTLASFPTYSKHDESHAYSVLHNIEMILGEERISELSASDCFVLLHTVYIHDIGMCITYEDRENIVQNRQFLEMVDELEEEGDNSLSLAIEALKRTDYSYDSEEEEIVKTQKLYEDKLQVYYALIHLIANYRRGEHGVRSKERLYDWTLNPDKLGIGFSLSGIPLRIFLSIANSAQLHTNPKFEEILKLPQEDDGFALDYYHPRFISVLLQLGDILDMDNNRFHPLTKECMGSLPELSEQHYDKHLSIRRLHIRPDKISIEADCKTQEALRLVRKECDMLISMLQSAGYYWSIICPPDFKGSLPTVGEVKLFLEGRMIPEELVTTQFQISQRKAFSLLEGANVYSGRYVFLREFLQNAVDATKMQYWNECCGTKGYYDNPKMWKKATPYELNKKVSIDNFPIEIEMEIQKKDKKGNITPVSEEDIKLLDDNRNTYSYGVNVRIKDFGTGIDKDRILSISNVGRSRKHEKELIESMPEWLRPTAEFGVGLQSAFLLTGSFKCNTYTRTGQKYEITFGSVSASRYEGYINVKPLEYSESKAATFGTCFEVFVPCDKKFLHQDCFEAWNGEDAFDEYYECRKPLRHSAELMTQMALYLDDQVGEMLFPVRLHIKKSRFTECSLNKTEKSSIKHIDLSFEPKEEKEEQNDKKCYDKDGVRQYKREELFDREREWKKGKPSWIYSIDKYKDQYTESITYGAIEKLQFLLDCSNGKLHVWDGEKNVFFVASGENLTALESTMQGGRKRNYSFPNGTRIYYKGIKLQRRCIEADSEFIEYIDMKGGLQREFINLSRNKFTAEGERYFEQVIYHSILFSVKKILKYLAQQYQEKNVFLDHICNHIKKECENLEMLDNEIQKLQSITKAKNPIVYPQDNQHTFLKEKMLQRTENVKKLKEHIVSVVMLAYLAMREDYNQIGCMTSERVECPWEKIVNKIIDILEKHHDVLEMLRNESSFFNIISYEESCNYQLGRSEKDKNTRQRTNFADIFSTKYSYAVVQERENDLRPWKQHLIQLSDDENIKEKIMELKFIRSEEERKRCEEEIENWGNKILKNARNFREAFFVSDDSKQQFITKWILKSVPTVAMFANEQGNIRVNVLSNKTLPFVYLNDNFKLLIMQRIIETWNKNGIKRFSTFSWHSNMYLGCQNVPYKIYYIKRGYMGDFSLNRVIIPLGDAELSKISAVLTDDSNQNIISKMLRLYERVSLEEYIQQIYQKYCDDRRKMELTPEEMDACKIIDSVKGNLVFRYMNEPYFELVLSTIYEEYEAKKYDNWQEIVSGEEITQYFESEEEWHEIFRNIIQIYCELLNSQDDGQVYRKAMRAVTKGDAFKKLCKLWIYLSYNFTHVADQELQVPKIQEEYFKKLKTDSKLREKQKRIYHYVLKHGDFKMTEENIANCYLQFTEELFDLFKKMEVRNSRIMLKMIPEKEQTEILRKIGSLFEKK